MAAHGHDVTGGGPWETVHGVELFQPGDMVCQAVRREGRWENDSIAMWRGSMLAGRTALDVGAYNGIYSIIAAQEGAIPVAYECSPHMCARARKNAERNGVEIDLRQKAAGSKIALGYFVTPFDTSSAGSVAERHGANRKRLMIDIEPPRIDVELCAVKIDVEGYELEVLKGIEQYIERDRPICIIEALNEYAASEIVKFFNFRNYIHRWADQRNLVFLPCA